MAEPLLAVCDLHAAHAGAEVLRGVDLEATTGEVVVLLGANGAGKSTLLRCLAGRVPATSGRIRFEGLEVSAMSTRQRIRRGIVLCPEGRHLFADMSVRENLLLGAHLRRDVGRMRDDLGVLCEQIDWLQDRLEQPAGTLSGGEQQMVAVARAMMARPRLLLLDEPSIGLSPAALSGLGAWLRLQSSRSGVTILCTEQNVAFGRSFARRCIVLTGGRVEDPDERSSERAALSKGMGTRLFGLSPPAAES